MTNGDLVSPLQTGVGPSLVLEQDCGQLTLSLLALSQPSPHEHGQVSLLSVSSVLVTTVSFAQLGRTGRYLFPRHVLCLIARTSLGGEATAVQAVNNSSTPG